MQWPEKITAFSKNAATMLALTAGTLLSLGSHSCAADTAIIYPDLRAPYNQIFNDIISGINRASPEPIKSYPLDKNFDPSDLQLWLKKNSFSGTISLGSRSIRALNQIENPPPSVVLGAIVNPSKGIPYSAISLSPSPRQLFQQAKALKPQLKSIHVIYITGKQNWLIKQAQLASDNLDIELQTIEAASRKQAALEYHHWLQQFKSQHRHTHILWLAQNSARLEKALLNEILQQAWEKEITVISSNLADLKRGALIALYPHNEAMGGSLSKLLEHVKQHPTKEIQIHPAKDLHRAINLRTAEHLGIHLKHSQKQNFQFIYPPDYR